MFWIECKQHNRVFVFLDLYFEAITSCIVLCQFVPVLTRIGASDRTIHPYFARRMYRLLLEHDVNVTYVELPHKEHWWWDTT